VAGAQLDIVEGRQEPQGAVPHPQKRWRSTKSPSRSPHSTWAQETVLFRYPLPAQPPDGEAGTGQRRSPRLSAPLAPAPLQRRPAGPPRAPARGLPGDLGHRPLHHELQSEYGYGSSYPTFRRQLLPLRPPILVEPEIRFETGPGVQSQADWKALGTSCGLRQTTAHSDALVVRRWPPLDVVARVKPTLGGPHLAETKRR